MNVLLSRVWEKKPQTLAELRQDTSLEKNVLLNALRSLIQAKMVKSYQQQFYVNHKSLAKITADKKNDMRDEVKELIETTVEQYFNQQGGTLSLKKVWMTRQDEKIFQVLLSKVDHFLNELKHYNQEIGLPLSEKKVFYWGMSTYKNTIDGQVQLV